MSEPDLGGHYAVSDWGFSIVEREGGLVMVSPGVPEEFEPRLERIGASSVRVTGGFLTGVEIEFTTADGRVTGALAGGVIPLEPLEEPPELAPGGGLRPPDFGPDPERDAAFEGIWAGASPERPLDTRPYPVHEFVQWLDARQEVIFHGSNRTDIEEFVPRRESIEFHNQGGHGNLGAVYGTNYGLWAMFFAVIDRANGRGSIRNGVATYQADDGRTLDLYRFSVDHRVLPERPFTRGALYLLPREGFEQIPFYPGGPPGSEWACFDTVRPLARLDVAPEDFPFLDQVGGHDDGDLLRLSDLNDEVFSHLAGSTRTADGFRLVFEGLDQAIRDEWIELGRRYLPDVERTVVDGNTIEVAGPSAYLQTMERRFEELAGESSD